MRCGAASVPRSLQSQRQPQPAATPAAPAAHGFDPHGFARPPQPAASQAAQEEPYRPGGGLSAAQLAEISLVGKDLVGDASGHRLAQLLVDLGVAVLLPGAEGSVRYQLPPPLTERAFGVDRESGAPLPGRRGKSALVRGSHPVQAGRRFVGRTADDMILVPSMLALLHARASQDPEVLCEPGYRQCHRDELGRLLLTRGTSCVIFSQVELPDGREAIDVLACSERAGPLPYTMLADALELLRLCSYECAPGAQTEHHVIGERGLDEQCPPSKRPTAPVGIILAAARAGKPAVLFGGQQQSLLKLLGEVELQAYPPPKLPPSPPKLPIAQTPQQQAAAAAATATPAAGGVQGRRPSGSFTAGKKGVAAGAQSAKGPGPSASQEADGTSRAPTGGSKATGGKKAVTNRGIPRKPGKSRNS